FDHAHLNQLVEGFGIIKPSSDGHSGAGGLLSKLEAHRNGGHLGIWSAVGVGEPIEHLKGMRCVDVDELPVAAGVLALGTGHMVIGAAANSDIVLGKGGRPAWWTPEALNLSGVHVGLPQTLLGD